MSERERESATVPSVWNVPNALTLVRVLLVPLYAVLLLQDQIGPRVWAVVVFTVAAFTDQLDGYIARSRNLITDFGKLADTLADKILVVTALVLLSWLAELPWWVTIALTARELIITILKFGLAKRYVMPPSGGGRLKAALQMVGIAVLTMPWVALLGTQVGGWLVLAGQVIMYVATAIAVVTALDYFHKAAKVLRSGSAPT